MAICRLFIVFFWLAAAAEVQAATPEEFLDKHHADIGLINKVIAENEPINRCEITASALICMKGQVYPNIANNPQAKRAILQGLGLTVRNELYNALTKRIRAQNLKDGEIVGQALANGQRVTPLKGVEFITFSQGNWCGAIAAAPIANAEKELPVLYAQRGFILDYCKALLPKAKELLARGKNAEALNALKELHDLRYADIEAYLLAAKVFLLEKQPSEAAKIALELFDDFAEKMNSQESEDLGDLLLKLNLPDKAEKAYNIASSRL